MVGEKYSYLEVLGWGPNIGRFRAVYCRCACGTEKLVKHRDLKSGAVKSCGCKRYAYKSGGLKPRKPRRSDPNAKTKRPLYKILSGMKYRCKHNKNYTHVSVCEEWANSYEAFEKWALENGYAQGLSIDRIDGWGNYEPNNCRWATPKQQATNLRVLPKIFDPSKHPKPKLPWVKEPKKAYLVAKELREQRKQNLADLEKELGIT